jgi:putative transcriptional regulator
MSSPLAPAFLVALDVLLDPNFRRTVVLMLEHDPQQGAVGLVVNRSTELSLAQLCAGLDLAWRGAADARVSWGGPVSEEQGWVLLGDADAEGLADALSVIPGIRFSRSREALQRVAERPGLRARVLVGYAGWAPGQLEGEIAAGAWLVVPASEAIVFDESHERMWEQAIRSLGIEPALLVASQGVN